MRFLNRPRDAQNRDWFSKQVVGLLPALLLALVAVVAVEGLVRGYAVPLAQIPPPSAVLQKLWEARAVLLRDTGITLLEVFVGFVIGGALGFVTAMATQRSRFLEQGLMPYATLFPAFRLSRSRRWSSRRWGWIGNPRRWSWASRCSSRSS
ncbi:MAG: hypothetical protein HC933_10280 [Pleurocapsa sp. SU_196_0]|nr:hypothetical protein [Pleurocapsa sp. SU_196_0]